MGSQLWATRSWVFWPKTGSSPTVYSSHCHQNRHHHHIHHQPPHLRNFNQPKLNNQICCQSLRQSPPPHHHQPPPPWLLCEPPASWSNQPRLPTASTAFNVGPTCHHCHHHQMAINDINDIKANTPGSTSLSAFQLLALGILDFFWISQQKHLNVKSMIFTKAVLDAVKILHVDFCWWWILMTNVSTVF